MPPSFSPPASAPTASTPSGWHLFNTLATSLALGLMLSPFLYELGTALGLVSAPAPVRSSCGDTPDQYLALYVGLGWGSLVGLLLAGVQAWRRRRWAVPAVLLDLTALYLSLVLLQYGLIKVLAAQFPHLWANQDTPPAELTPMRVAWQFFGYSRPYQQFLGWGEVLPGLLLLGRRTRTLGAVIATVVMLNVFLVNIFFDVCVKIGSGSYLALALLLLLQDADRLWQFFIGHRTTALRSLPATAARFGRRGRVVYRVLGALLTLAVLGLTYLSVQQGQQQAANQEAAHPYTGVWQTARAARWQAARWQAGRWQPLAPTDSAFPARAYFQGNQLVLRNALRRDRFMAEPDSARPQAVLQLVARNENNDYAAPRRWQFHLSPPDSLHLQGRWRQDSVRLTLRLHRELMK